MSSTYSVVVSGPGHHREWIQDFETKREALEYAEILSNELEEDQFVEVEEEEW